MTATRAQLVMQLDNIRHNGLLDLLKAAAEASGLPLSYVVAIASRETNCTNELGDLQGGQFHGVGILQGDIQHPEVKRWRDDGSWKSDPHIVINWCVALLAAGVKEVRAAWAGDIIGGDEVLKCAASGYNCGVERALAGDDAGDSDLHTTGKDYGQDVMARKKVFDQLLAANSP